MFWTELRFLQSELVSLHPVLIGASFELNNESLHSVLKFKLRLLQPNYIKLYAMLSRVFAELDDRALHFMFDFEL